MPNRAFDWLKQAEKDLKHAQKALELGPFEWACFASQQAAEKTVKALYCIPTVFLRARLLSILGGCRLRRL